MAGREGERKERGRKKRRKEREKGILVSDTINWAEI